MSSDSPMADHDAVAADAKVLRLRISLKGRPLRTVSVSKHVVTLGRDPESDVQLDNPGISRHHLVIEKTPDGYFAKDLCSANGTFLNDEPIQRKQLQNNDVLRVGKFTIWISYEDDRRGTPGADTTLSPTTDQGTTVLSPGELDKLMTKIRQYDPNPKPKRPEKRDLVFGVRRILVKTAVYAFAMGATLGAGLTWVLTH